MVVCPHGAHAAAVSGSAPPYHPCAGKQPKGAAPDRVCRSADRGSTLGKFKLDAETILRENENPDKPYSIVTLDIDKFKYINEMFGYREGDRAILFLSAVLEQSLRAGELCAHKGADNFVLLLQSGIEGDLPERLETINARMQEFQEPGGGRVDLVLSMRGL